MFLLTALSCAVDGPQGGADPAATDGTRPDRPDPFVRVNVDAISPALDAVFFQCEGGEPSLVAEVAGRAAAARVVVLRTADGAPQAHEATLTPVDMPEGSLWTRFEHQDPALPCDPSGYTAVVEALDADGATVDCVAFGHQGRAVVDGLRDDRLGAITRGDWDGCRVR